MFKKITIYKSYTFNQLFFLIHYIHTPSSLQNTFLVYIICKTKLNIDISMLVNHIYDHEILLDS